MIIKHRQNHPGQRHMGDKCTIQIQSGEAQRTGRRALWKLGCELSNDNNNTNPSHVCSIFIFLEIIHRP